MKQHRHPRPEAAFAFIITALVSIAVLMLLSWVILGLIVNRGENHPSFALLGLGIWVISFPHCLHPFYGVYKVVMLLLGVSDDDC